MAREPTSLATQGRHSTRNPTACDHCRVARIRCQSSEQPGVCARCLALKRECVIRAKSRPRRRGRNSAPSDSEPTSLLPTHRDTFTINYSVPVRVVLNDPIEAIRGLHEYTLSSILFGEEVGDSPSPSSQSTGLSRRGTLPNGFDVKNNIWRQPLFDTTSAEALLKIFRHSINYMPFISLPDDITVSQLAATKPFVLLAILTVASGSVMVQNHALYDDEFRKALGLKYASAGERSLELLQGLLIYCAWHPFQLRPKDGQLEHCLRIAGDVVHDIHLDEDIITTPDSVCREMTDDELDKIRAYLAYQYLSLTYVVIWKGERNLPISDPSWSNIALETLESHAKVDGDSTLVALVRTSSLFAHLHGTTDDEYLDTAANCQAILRRLEQEFIQLQPAGNQLTTGLEVIRMQVMFVDIFLDCGGLLLLPVSKTYSHANKTAFCPHSHKLYAAVKKIGAFLDYVLNLEDTALVSFTINDWTRLIVVIILSFRVSFPLPSFPDYESAYARSEIHLDNWLGKMSQGADNAPHSDILSASRYMFALAKSKYELRLAFHEKSPSNHQFGRTFGCPVMSGHSGRSRKPVQSNSPSSSESSDCSEQRKLPLFHDIWATMTLGWQGG